MGLLGRRRTEGHRALEDAGREIRKAQGSERDEILAARKALRGAEKSHDTRVNEAERELSRARAPDPIAAYGHEFILYDDRLTAPDCSHDLVHAVRASVHEVEGSSEVELVVEAPEWRETVRGPGEDAEELRQLAASVERAAAAVSGVVDARQPAVDAARRELEAAREDRLHVAEVAPLVHHVSEICGEGEEVLDLAPALWTGHDGVLVATNRRLMFVGLRANLSLPYREIRSLSSTGRFFGARLIVTTRTGRVAIGGLLPERASELAALATERVDAAVPA